MQWLRRQGNDRTGSDKKQWLAVSSKGLRILDCGWAKCVQSGLNRFFSNFQLYSRLQFVFNARKSHTKPHYLFVLGCEDDLSAWARQRCCPLTQSWKSDEMKTTSPHEPGRDVALSRSPERRYKMKTTSPSQQIPSSLTELSLVDQINTHFWTLHQTKLCNCDIPLAQGKNVVHRAMTLQDEPDRGDMRILFYRHSLLQQLDVHIATL